jgi:hypothetical protein
MKWTGQTSVFLFLGILFTLPLMIPLLPKNIALGYDTTAHLTRIWALSRALHDGSFPPRWSSFLAFGYGSPVLMFNWSLPYYLGSLFLWCGASLFGAYQGIVAATIIASFVSMYIFLLCLAPPFWACIGALSFSWAPYRFNINYLRGAIGENTGLIFWPIILLAVLLVFKKEYRKGLLIGSAAFALSILSHHVLFLMIAPVFILLAAFRFFRTKNLTALRVSALTLFFGITLASYFWIPAYFEKGSIGFSSIQSLYQDNFLVWTTLVSHPLFASFEQDPYLLLWAIGWPQIGVLVFSFIFLVRMFIQKRLRSAPLLFFFLVVTLGALFLITSNSRIVWDRVPLLPMFVYPQRFLGLVIFAISVMATLVLSMWTNKKNRTIIFSVAFISIIFFNASSVMLIRVIAPLDIQKFNVPVFNTTDMTGEFMPNTIPKDFMWNAGRYEHTPLLSVLSGDATVRECTQKSSIISCVVETKTPASFRLRQFYFPGWVAYGDTGRIPLEMDPADGTIRFDVPANAKMITARFGNTPLRTFANWLTILSLGIYVVCIIVSVKKIRPK